ncbi:MAG TPA: hypothetical protein VNL77_10375 [Roseiflexaceae bacterium]|nr:hypothetical protein [Roseiflexaceae bacterium]
MRRLRWTIVAVAGLMLFLAGGAPAAGAAETFPSIIRLPNGFQPEGVVTGHGPVIYAGSLANGAIYAADLRTGEGQILAHGETGRTAVGLAFDRRTSYIFAAGGGTGTAAVYDARSGARVAEYTLAGPPTFINDVVVTRDAAYFTDSFNAVLYRLPLSAGGALPDQSQVQAITLGGDWVQVPGFNANGIDATPNGKTLIVVNSTRGELYTVDPTSGAASRIDLGGGSVTNGDGILLDGKTLYVVRNRLNEIAVVELSTDLTSGHIARTISDPAFRVPTTIAEFGSALYAVNARFGTPPTPATEYEIVQVAKG